jgi:predicted glycoside hydrolase/deacetylase ChbG (UPF0249 family)
MQRIRKKLAAVLIPLSLMMGGAVWAGAQQAQQTQLIIRGDDMGMTQGSLAAFEKAFNEGVLTSAAIQACAPWFEGAAALCRKNPGWCVGVHLTLVGEWQGYRWRPVMPWDKVKSIVDEDGFLYTDPTELFAHKPKIEEIEAEYRAQIALVKKRGVKIGYIDTHYLGYQDYPGIEEVFQKLARENDVPISEHLNEGRMPGVYLAPVDQKPALAAKQLRELKPGLWLWVCHIGIDSPEQDALFHTKPEAIFPGPGVGKHRAAELQALLSNDVKAAIMQKGIRLVSYSEVYKERKR